MSIDLSQDYSTIKAKLSALTTVLENDKNESILRKSRDGNAQDLNNQDINKPISEFSDGVSKSIKTVKSQFDELIDIFKYTLPNDQSGSYNSTLIRVFSLAAINTKEEVLQIVVEED